jgi:uncharacterized protein (TIGR01244 family)
MSTLSLQRGLGVLALSLCVPAFSANLDTLGIPNLHQVNENLFRSGQPSPESWPKLAKLGVTTVIDLRRVDEHSTEAEAKAVTAAGMTYVNVPMKGVVAPSEAQMAQILSVLLKSQGPVLVHCKRGADRTGAVVACYRIAHDRWKSKQALAEAKSHGMAWTQLGLKQYIMSFQPASYEPAL